MKKSFIITFLVFATIVSFAFQIIKTQVVITVRNELGNTEANATVTLFKTETDYEKEVNPIQSGVTDAKGVVKFKDLEAIPYFVKVQKEDKDNAGGGEKIEALVANRINKVTIVIQ
ncbi:MAG: hypothetical protein O9302_12535 [Cyclobacteriaceae bacterium]|jgi:hypothetical protein|nr:hypothetical protein [Flammeovirgaceae bacterium]MCZ8023466.1 hypothetical protein [Cytophagales bacterium]MCZ8328884.1 hypothetical protein [Cyclobacteriaceae bacterium]